MLTPTSFKFEVKEKVGLITLNRPDTLNSLTFQVYRELTDLFAQLEREPSVRAVVITGEGRGFCSGGDQHDIIKELFSRDMPGLVEFTRMTCDLIKNIRALKKPVIAALNGTAAGAGAVIALASDLRVASDKAKIAFLFTKVGLAGADMGAAYLLPKVVGLSRATEILMFGDALDAATAEKFGLYNKVVPTEQVVPEAMAWATRLANGPTFALGMTKELLNAELSQDLWNALENEARAQAVCMQTLDFREAYDAFSNKRPPNFQGK
ncbi:MAG: enoyl-CoA hydratase family protein [Archangium gephyra]|uniref:Enoyl-CoA hydratase family protein n=1 Tax=Archangium gephyra TaxID=48 RepID=A0A2W5U556_9BACT|nr:MAG: enoyl-CoA hydratase family protein [Archangium gephyra]